MKIHKLCLMSILSVFLVSNISFASLSKLKEIEDNRMANAPLIAEYVKSQNPKQRIAVARAMGRIQKPVLIPSLILLAHDKNQNVKKEAVFALGQYGWQDSFHEGMVEQLNSELLKTALDKTESARVRALAVESYGKQGVLETPERIKSLLDEKNPEIISHALMALYRYRLVLALNHPEVKPGLFSEEIVQKLNALADQLIHKENSVIAKLIMTKAQKEVHQNLIYLFARVKDERFLPSILKFSKSKNHWERYFAAGALTKLAKVETLPTVIALSQDENAQVQIAALQAVAAIKTTKDLPVALVQSKDFQVRLAYEAALAADSNVKEETLLKLTADSSAMVRAQTFHDLISKNTSSLFLYIEDGLNDENWVVREGVTSALGSLSKPDLKLLERALKDSDVHVRASALEALASVDGQEALKDIQSALGSSSLSERGSAVDALSQRSEAEIPQIAWQTYLNSQDHKWTELRESLIGILAAVTSDETTQNLKEALKDPAPSVAAAAKTALTARGVTPLPTLPETKLTYSPFRDLKFKTNPIVKVTTERGVFIVECYAKAAPIHVANFVGQVKSGFYNGLLWHRMVSNFVVQGGDPDGSGWGDAGYSLRAEINPVKFKRGTLGMPRSTGFDTGGVQLFFNHVPTPNLDGQYTVFGQVVRGLNVIDQLEVGDHILKAEVL